MMKAGKPVNVGDHIEYVVCEKEGVKAAAERAFHPEDVERSEGELKVRASLLGASDGCWACERGY